MLYTQKIILSYKRTRFIPWNSLDLRDLVTLVLVDFVVKEQLHQWFVCLSNIKASGSPRSRYFMALLTIGSENFEGNSQRSPWETHGSYGS